MRAVLALAGTIMTLVAWLLSSPHGSSPDDPYHLSSIWCAAGFEEGVCQFVGDGLETGEVYVPAPVARVTCFVQPPTDASCSPAMFTESVDELREAAGAGNVERERPGVYYRAMHVLIGPDVFTSIWRMRVANALLAVVVSALVLAVSRPAVRQALVASWLVTAIPLGVFLVTSTNSGAWGVIGLANLWAALLTALEPGPRPRRIAAAALALLTATMALGSRIEALPYTLVTVAVVVVLAWNGDLIDRLRGDRRAAGLALAAVITVAVLATSWRGAGYVTTALEAFDSGFTRWTQLGVGNAAFYNLLEFPTLYAGAFGWAWGLGWLDAKLPPLTFLPAVMAMAGLVFVGIGRTDRRKSVAVGLVVLAMAGYPLLAHAIRGLLIYDEYQPRQFIALLTLLVALTVLAPAGRPLVTLARPQRVAVAVAVAVANSTALHVNTRRYTLGPPPPLGAAKEWWFDLDRTLVWWWAGAWSPMTNWVIGTVGTALVASVAVGAFRPRTTLALTAHVAPDARETPAKG